MNADLEFDGERYVPGTPGEIAYEHWHRYAFVRRFAKGKRVLDAACGEGYGTALLAPVAASATGVDIDVAVVAHATARYGSNTRLQYRAGSVAELPFADASFDLVVSFETIEHLAAADQPRMLAEFGRVLTPRGLLILSSPNKQRYSEANDYENPFHQHELDRDELVRCLDAAFPHRRWFHQQPLFASAIWSEGRIEGTALGEAWCGHADSVDALNVDDGVYYVVLAARTAEALPTRESRISIYVDSDDSELKRVRFQASEVMRLDRQMHERNDLVDRKDEHIRHLERLVAERERLIIERDAQLGPMNSMREAAEHATSAARDALLVAERARDEQLALVVQRDRELVAARQTGASAQAEGEPPRGRRRGAGTDDRAPAELAMVAASAVDQAAPRLAAMARRMSAIDIVIPVYNAAADLARCVDSVLAHTAGEYALVLIDDGSPETSVAAYFEALARRRLPHIEILRNESNLGFTLTANRGLSRSTADVVLLNSDTVVTEGWLDALVRCARSDPSIGTVTPFSNNAEICSYPRFCENNAWPEGADPAPVRDALARAAVPSYPDLPTGVGFCLYVRRALIDAIGVFDPVFGHGYGEENDFCLRAAKAGFRNVLCDDAFVVHLGERSFAGRKSELGVGNMQRLLERHPEYLDLVRGYIAADPLRAIRGVAQLRERIDSSGLRGVMHVIHGHGGGTEHHARALIEASRERFRHYLVTAVGDAWQLEEPLPEGGMREFRFERAAGETWRDFTGGLCATFGVDLIHLHNVSGSREGILGALLALGIPYGYTAHDLNVACPTITFLNDEGKYCGAETDAAVCARCLAAQPAFAQTDIVAWRARHRAALAGAAFLIAPSRWVATTMARYFADRPVDVIPLAAPSIDASAVAEAAGAKLPAPSGHRPLSVPDDGIPTVAVLGAVGPDKGARRLERMVELARAGRLRLRFVLIGYLDRLQTPWQSDDALFTVHARYAARELPELLAHYRVRLVAFPSACPETFSFTLSEAWNAGRPVVVPPIGALAERVADTGAGWVLSEDDWRDDARMLARIAELVAPERASELAAAADRARAMPQPSMATTVERSLAHYAAAVGDGTVNPWRRLAPFAPSRVLAALGYRPWHPPTVAGSASSAATPSSAHDDSAGSLATPAPRDTALSQLAWRLGGSRLGRVLRRMMPAPLRDALKSRLF